MLVLDYVEAFIYEPSVLFPTFYSCQPQAKNSHLELIAIDTVQVILRINVNNLDFHFFT